jgi:hypothetical protein
MNVYRELILVTGNLHCVHVCMYLHHNYINARDSGERALEEQRRMHQLAVLLGVESDDDGLGEFCDELLSEEENDINAGKL